LFEYVIAVACAMVAYQSPTPRPLVIVAIIIGVNAAVSKGALGAFQWIPKRVHRVIDVVVVGLMILIAIVMDADLLTRLVIVLLAIVLVVLVLGTNFAEKTARQAGTTSPSEMVSERSEDWGRKAGRLAGRVGRAARGSDTTRDM
jgi:Ca2+/Na+ antiporter